MVLKMDVNNLSLKWPMDEGNIDGICLFNWLKVIYESAENCILLYSSMVRKFGYLI